MANKPISNIGILLSYATSESGSYINLYSITSIPELGGDNEQIDVTTIFDSKRANMPGVESSDDLTFAGNRGKYGAPDAQESALVDEYAALEALDEKTALYWKLTYPDGSSHKWSAYPKVRQAAVEVNSAVGYNLTLTTNSKIEFTPAT